MRTINRLPGIFRGLLCLLLAIFGVTMSGPAAAAQTETVLYNFGFSTGQPFSGLVFDQAGNLYGAAGGVTLGESSEIFELSSLAGGGWTESTLFTFGERGDEGVDAEGTLVLDSQGNLFGTTGYGGASSCYNGRGCGTVFELLRTEAGSWRKKTLHSFNGYDGAQPTSGVIFDAQGNL